MRYNPMAYIHSEKDVLKLVTALMTNTKGEGQGGDPFWDKAERLLLVSLIAYLHYEAPVEEQNFATLLEMLNTIRMALASSSSRWCRSLATHSIWSSTATTRGKTPFIS